MAGAELVFHIDGGSRGNPGTAGYGVVVSDAAGRVLDRLHAAIGRQTNNYAEYRGLLAALRYALERGAPRVRVVTDSELMVHQMTGRYAVKSPNLIPVFKEARRLAGQIPDFAITHVRREHNREADRLANLAMDASSRPQP